jgi:integrase
MEKPTKPYDDFPLYAHASGRWAKKINGKVYYFGYWRDGWEKALATYQAQRDDLYAGRKPKTSASTEEVRVGDVVNHFLGFQEKKLKNGDIGRSTWLYCITAGKFVASVFGKNRLASDLGPRDFTLLRQKMNTRWAHTSIAKNVTIIKHMFRRAYDTELLQMPVRFGPDFKGPSQKTLRICRAQRGLRLFTADQIRTMLDAAGPQLRAVIYLGINCAFGSTDCACLPLSALDLDNGWVNFARVKTGIDRRCPLWPETVEALKAAIKARPTPKSDKHLGLVFIAPRGKHYHTAKTISSPLGKVFAKLLKRLGIKGSAYHLRRTFRTVADAAKDQVAANAIMGHADTSMASHYRETIDDSRLIAVTDHVHRWLLGNQTNGVQNGSGTAPAAPGQPNAAEKAS